MTSQVSKSRAWDTGCPEACPHTLTHSTASAFLHLFWREGQAESLLRGEWATGEEDPSLAGALTSSTFPMASASLSAAPWRMLGTCFALYLCIYVSFTYSRAQGCLRFPVALALRPSKLAPLTDLASGGRHIGASLKCSCNGQPCIGEAAGVPWT